jgi:O-antigen/teichoic acid export membrane protein
MTDASSPFVPPRDDQEAVREPPESIAGTVATGLKWKLASTFVREGTRLGVAVVLARILTPAEWGLAAMALVLSAFLEMIPDTMTVGLVQRARITELDRSTIFWTAMAIGACMSILGVAASGAVAAFYDEPDVQALFAAVSIGFAIAAAACVPEALLMRDLNYRAIELRHIAAVLVGGATALTLAFAGAGSWAIIGNSLAALSTSCALLWWFTRWRPSRVFSRASLTDLGADGVRVLGTRTLTYFQMNGDKLLIGRYLGAGALGNYQFAYQLMFTPVGNIAYPLQYVLFPVFATIQGDAARLDAAWLRAKRLSVAAMAPAFLTLLVVAPDLIQTIFGSKWEGSVSILQLLCVAGVAYSLSTQNWSLLVVRDRTRVLLRLTLLNTAVILSAVAIGIALGEVDAVAAMLAVAYWTLVLPELWITAHWGSVDLRSALRATLSPLPFAVAAALVAFGVRILLVEVGVPSAVRLVLCAALLLALYAALAYVGSAALRGDMRKAIDRLASRLSARRTGEATPR